MMAAPSQLSWWRYCVVKLKKLTHLLTRSSSQVKQAKPTHRLPSSTLMLPTCWQPSS